MVNTSFFHKSYLYFQRNSYFCRSFCWWVNVAINVEAKKIIANDIDKNIIELYQYFQENNSEDILQDIEHLIDALDIKFVSLDFKETEVPQDTFVYQAKNKSNDSTIEVLVTNY